MVTDAIDFYFNSSLALFNVILNSWLLSAFFFVSILGMIASIVIQVRNKS